MSDKDHWYLESEKKPSLRMWIFNQMAMGAVYAALVFFGAILIIFIIRAIGALLPENPYASLEMLREGTEALTRLI